MFQSNAVVVVCKKRCKPVDIERGNVYFHTVRKHGGGKALVFVSRVKPHSDLKSDRETP